MGFKREKVKNTVIQGKMNKDLDERLIPEGQIIDALNVRISNSENSDVGALENSLGNRKLTNLDLGNNPFTIGGCTDEFEEKIYYLVLSDQGNYVIEYDINNDISSYVLIDTRVGDQNVLGFNENYLVTGINIIVDTDNGDRYLAWVDGENKPPRFVNIERAKTYGENGFEEKDICTVKAPPIFPPRLELVETSSNQENLMKERFFSFGYRFKYEDEQYSAPSVLTTYAFRPSNFKYDFNSSTNESMVNRFNAVNISFNTGDKRVVGIDLLFKESETDTLFIAESFDKLEKGWGDNETVTAQFANNKIYQALPEDELFRMFDGVPLYAKSQEFISNRLVYGNYVEGYNIEDCEGEKIYPNFNLGYESFSISDLEGKPTNKTNRDYEAVLVYLDKFGRQTTGLKSTGNSIHIPISEAENQNLLTLNINSKAPCFAEYYRVFLKESKHDFDIIVPTLFYKQGNYTYFYIQPAEASKIKENDFLIVKSDTSGPLQSVEKLRVLEVDRKDADFLEPLGLPGGQPEGFYIKVSLTGSDVIFDENSYEYIKNSDYDEAENADHWNGESDNYNHILFKGDTLDDISTTFNAYSGEDLRYEVEIFSTGTPDTFRWRTQDKAGQFSDWNDNSGAGIQITGSSQILDSDLSITFNNTTGHSSLDKWMIKKNVGIETVPSGFDEDNRAYACIRHEGSITTGSIITLKYYAKQEKSSDIDEFIIELVSNNDYQNLEEWYYGDEVYNVLSLEPDFDQTLDKTWFRNILVEPDTQGGVPREPFQYTMVNESSTSALIIESRRSARNSSRNVYSDSYFEIRKLDNLPLMETESIDIVDDVYYEVGETYNIDQDGNHLGSNVSFQGKSDTPQELSSQTPAKLYLPIHNAFGWGNSFESYKIKDLFNAKGLSINSRPTAVVNNYKRNKRIASLIYGGVFQQNTRYNGLNEFNLSLGITKDLDDKYGSIQKLYSEDTNLISYQEDKIFNILIDKDILYNADGTGNVRQSSKFLGQEVPYSGEFGISTSPESHSVYGKSKYNLDPKRGVALRLSNNGLTTISMYGMKDWFKDIFRERPSGVKLGGYDPYFNQFTLSIKEEPEKAPLILECGNNIYKSNVSEEFNYIFKLNDLVGDVVFDYNVSQGSIIIEAVFNGNTYTSSALSGSGTFSFERDTLSQDEVSVTITPVLGEVEYSILHACPVGVPSKIGLIIINDEGDTGKTMTSRFKWNNSLYFSEVPVFQEDGVTLFEIEEGVKGVGKFPVDNANIVLEAYKDYINSGDFNEEAANQLGYLVSSTEYTEADVDTILQNATFPAITTLNEDGVPETNRIGFTFNPASQNDILYLIWNYRSLSINRNTYIYIYFDSSGSMDDTLAPLETMRDTLLKDALLPLYDGDEALYNSRVIIRPDSSERTMNMLNVDGDEPEGNVISLVFQDEANPIYQNNNFDGTTRTTDYDSDLSVFRGRLNSFTSDYYRGVVFQVQGDEKFNDFINAVNNGTGAYSGVNGLSDRSEVNFKFNIQDGGTPDYYLDLILEALNELGYDI